MCIFIYDIFLLTHASVCSFCFHFLPVCGWRVLSKTDQRQERKTKKYWLKNIIKFTKRLWRARRWLNMAAVTSETYLLADFLSFFLAVLICHAQESLPWNIWKCCVSHKFRNNCVALSSLARSGNWVVWHEFLFFLALVMQNLGSFLK